MELVTVQEAAKMMRVSPVTVRRRIAEGRLLAVRVGRGIRIPSEAINRFVTPVAPDATGEKHRPPRERQFSMKDPLWSLLGAGQSAEPTDASKVDEYLADAYAPKLS